MYTPRMASLVVLLLSIASARAAHAERPGPARFLLDGVVGLGVPLADTTYRDHSWPSPIFGLHLGAEIPVGRRISLAPEVGIDLGPVIGRSATTTIQLRLQPGLRVLIGFGHGHAFFFRALVGASLFIFTPGGVDSPGKINAGVGFEPGMGMQFRIAPRAVAGFTVGTPVSFHTYGQPLLWTYADLQVAAFVGYRR